MPPHEACSLAVAHKRLEQMERKAVHTAARSIWRHTQEMATAATAAALSFYSVDKLLERL
jgi:hypothetical protein